MSGPARSAAVAGLALAVLVPPRMVERGPVLCPFHRATGRPCPTCGLTRSMVHLAHGGVRAGLARHAFGPIALFAVAAVAFGVDLGAWLRARPGRSNRWRIATGLAAAAWTGYALVRMLTTRPAVDPPTGLQLRAG